MVHQQQPLEGFPASLLEPAAMGGDQMDRIWEATKADRDKDSAPRIGNVALSENTEPDA